MYRISNTKNMKISKKTLQSMAVALGISVTQIACTKTELADISGKEEAPPVCTWEDPCPACGMG